MLHEYQGMAAELDYYDRRILALLRRSSSDRMRRQDVWRINYLSSPYLLMASEGTKKKFLLDVFENILALSSEGLISTNVNRSLDSGIDGESFTHLIEASNSDGGLRQDYVAEASKNFNRYLEPTARERFAFLHSRVTSLDGHIAKFTQKKFAEEMMSIGRIRISPASFYSTQGLLAAQVDYETRRDYYKCHVREIIRNKAKGYAVNGITHGFKEGNYHGITSLPDYFLYSACQSPSRRLPIDFNADAAVLIQDIPKFVRRVTEQVYKSLGEVQIIHGLVEYYNPYVGWRASTPREMTKHFRYRYQEEYRIVWRPKESRKPLEPFFVEVGSLDGIAELIT